MRLEPELSALARACLLGLLVLAALAGCAQSAKRTDSGARAAPAASVTTVAGAAPAASVEPRETELAKTLQGWKLGYRYSYRLSMLSQVSFGAESSSDFELTGRVEVVPVEVSAQTATLFIAVKGGKLVSRIPAAQSLLDARVPKLGSTYFATLQGGRVTEAHLAKDCDPLVANVYRTLSAALQVSRPAKPAPSWTAFEFDSTGQYAARYESTSDPQRLRKHKISYLRVLAGEAEQEGSELDLSPRVVSSSAELRFAKDGQLLGVSMSDELVMDNAQAPIAAKTVVTLSDGSVGPAGDRAALSARLRGTERLLAHAPHGAMPELEALDDARIGNLEFGDIVGRMEAAARRDKPSQPLGQEEQAAVDRDGARLFTALAATLRKRPELVAQVVSKIEGGSPAAQLLLDALGSAGNAPAQKALGVLLSVESKLAPEIKSSALLSLSRTAAPSPHSVRVLLALAASDGAPAQAMYGLGTFARLLGEQGESELRHQAGRLLIERLGQAKGQLKVSDCLKALANSAYEPAIPAIKPFLLDRREQVRVDAVTALRLMKAPEIDHLLAHALETDDADSVRKRALEVALLRDQSDVMVTALRGAATASSPHVRYGATKLLGEWLPQRPELRSLLEQLATSDAEQTIRDLAQAALQGA